MSKMCKYILWMTIILFVLASIWIFATMDVPNGAVTF